MLSNYNFPDDLKNMSESELDLLAGEIREFLLETLSNTGGHLASNLGVVELSIALHKVFDSPSDKIIWDVGHQSYVHKILTGRAKSFSSLRQFGGLSGFPKQRESEHDFFDTGHSSNSIAVALGAACARDIKGENFNVVAIIGDGSMTGGEAYEAMNTAGALETNMIVVLNDNEMSIDKSSGGLANSLARLRTSKKYYRLKKGLKKNLSGTKVLKGMEHIRNSIKYAALGGVMFEELGFTYIGPVNGHDISDLTQAFEIAKQAEGPVLLHTITKKGKGYDIAEKEPAKFHGTGPFDIESGAAKTEKCRTYSNVFGESITSLAERNSSIVAVTAAMCEGTGLVDFRARYPERFFDVGIAEESAVSFAAGLATQGLIPVVSIYSTFLQRAYDQIMMDVCLQKLHVIFAIDRAGVVGEDGETHHGIFDISYLSSLPNMTILAPKDASELAAMLEYAVNADGPVAIRYPRGKAENITNINGNNDVTSGAEVLKTGSDAEIWGIGKGVSQALKTAEILKDRYDIGVVNARYVKPADVASLLKSAARTKLIVSFEDNVITGGFGSILESILRESNAETEILKLAWPDTFIEHGKTELLFEKYGLDAASAAERISRKLEEIKKG